MKISIISDIEGISGSVWGVYGLPPSQELAYDTGMMTAEVATVINTLQEAGIKDISLYEAHAMQTGILPTGIKRTQNIEDIITGSTALFFIGQHAPAGVREAVLAHTMNSITTAMMTINGRLAGELTICAAYAGALGIPTVFISGDFHTGQEAYRNLPRPFQYVCDEIGLGNHTALCRPFASLERELRQKTILALDHIGRTRPLNMGRVRISLTKRYHGMGEKIASFPFVRRRGNALVIEARNMAEGFRLYQAATLGREFWDHKIRKMTK